MHFGGNYMNGSSFGTYFKIATFGESHGAALGVIVDGCPAGIPLSTDYIQTYLNRRKPGQNSYATPRKESDLVEILSGVFEGRTTGTPISMMVRNTSTNKETIESLIKQCIETIRSFVKDKDETGYLYTRLLMSIRHDVDDATIHFHKCFCRNGKKILSNG